MPNIAHTTNPKSVQPPQPATIRKGMIMAKLMLRIVTNAGIFMTHPFLAYHQRATKIQKATKLIASTTNQIIATIADTP
jgi:hypothetical protein